MLRAPCHDGSYFRLRPVGAQLPFASQYRHGRCRPQYIPPAHAFKAAQNILQCVVQCVSHMQAASHIGRRNNNSVWFSFGHPTCFETSIIFPRRTAPLLLLTDHMFCRVDRGGYQTWALKKFYTKDETNPSHYTSVPSASSCFVRLPFTRICLSPFDQSINKGIQIALQLEAYRMGQTLSAPRPLIPMAVS